MQVASVTERAEPTIADARDVGAVGDATAAFGLDLFQEVASVEDGNVIVGPYSAWLALAMTTVGASGSTYDELAAALRFPLEEERLLPAVNALDRTLTHHADDETVTFNVANRLWGQRGMTFQSPFLDAMVEHFGAPLAVADFASRPRVGAGPDQRVGGRANRRERPRAPSRRCHRLQHRARAGQRRRTSTRPWELAFDPDQTAPGPFTRIDGSTVRTELMHYDQYLPTAVDEAWAAVELPYEGGGLSMVVVVPNDYAAFEAGLDEATLDDILGRISDGGVHLTLPRFSFSTHASLTGPLQAMGVASAFDRAAADFGRMTEGGGLFVDAVEHEAFIDVNEEGTEAAASTGVVMAGSHGPTIDASRPFLFLIRDRATNAILFMGRVLDPAT